MNAKELLAMDEAALKKELADLMQAHFKLRMQHGTQQLQNPNQLRTTRRDIARVRTILAVGKVVSNKMQKTVTVLVERKVKHPLYGKFVLVSKKYHAHCESNDLTEGDTVEISETRPISKTKAWTVTKVIKKAEII